MEILSGIGASKDLTDLQIREYLQSSKIWETKLEDIHSSKVKAEKEIIGLDFDEDAKKKFLTTVQNCKEAVVSKIKDLKEEDAERGLYSLSKTVKDVAVYPAPFSGKHGEDVYKFTDKFKEAITANQIREKDKIEILKKHLKGSALGSIGDHFVSFDLAVKNLIDRYGYPQTTWESKIKHFKEKTNKPELWMDLGYKDRPNLIVQTLEFIREGEKLVKDHPTMESAVFGPATIKIITAVLPPDLTVKMVESGSGRSISPKDKLTEIKAFLKSSIKRL